jgi:hypothetical protein
MKKLVLSIALACASLSVGACTTDASNGVNSAGSVVSPANLETADKVFDALLDATNLLVDKGVIVPGSPTALRLAQAIRTVDAALDAGNSHEVQQGIALIRTIIAGAK